MSGRACKAAICCSAVSAKISKIEELIVSGLIVDKPGDSVLDSIIDCAESMDKMLDVLIDQIRES